MSLSFRMSGAGSVFKTSDSPELTGADGKTNAYSLQGARYNVYKVGKKNDTSTDAYVCTFTTDASGKGIVTKYNSDAGFYPVYGSDNRIYEVRGVPVGCWYYIAETGKKKGWNGNEYSYAGGYIVNKEEKKAASYYQEFQKIWRNIPSSRSMYWNRRLRSEFSFIKAVR